jgi:hypothetical protein
VCISKPQNEIKELKKIVADLTAKREVMQADAEG